MNRPANLARCKHCRRILLAWRLKGNQCRDRTDCSLAYGLWWRQAHGIEIPPDPALDDDGNPEPPEKPQETEKWTVPINAPPVTNYEPYARLVAPPGKQEELEL